LFSERLLWTLGIHTHALCLRQPCRIGFTLPLLRNA
jgi:hypothetical protein